MLQTQHANVPLISWKELCFNPISGLPGWLRKGTWNGQEVTIQEIHGYLGPDFIDDFKKEIDLIWQCQSPNVLHLHGVCMGEKNCGIVMERICFSLQEWLHEVEPSSHWELIRWQIALDIAQGLAHLHSLDVLHRDLSSQDIFIDRDGRAKISFFSIAKLTLDDSPRTGKRAFVGRIPWQAPEMFQDRAENTVSADVYSYGIVLWELLTRQLPFDDKKDMKTLISYLQNGGKEDIPDDCPKAWRTIITACWESAESRPTAAQIVADLKNARPKAWHFEGKPDSQQVPNYILQLASPADIQKVLGCYEHHPVPGYDIRKIEVVYNPRMNRVFSLNMEMLQARSGKPAFVPQWADESLEAQEVTSWRRKIHQRWQALAQLYKDEDYPDLKLIPLWHGTKPEVLESIFTTGYANLASTDAGFYGKGLYSTHEAQYAYRVYSQGALILNWVASYSAYPVIRSDMPKLSERGNYQNYDTHFIPVVPQDPTETVYRATNPGELAQYTEIVVFEKAQCLPRYLVTLQPTLPGVPSFTTQKISTPILFVAPSFSTKDAKSEKTLAGSNSTKTNNFDVNTKKKLDCRERCKK